jgi:O-antigen/teichoic acid export membrane protein
MKLGTKVAYNTLIQFLSKAVATGLGLIAIAVIARYLGTAGFGEYTTAITFLSFFGIIADLGLTLVTVQMISRPGVNESRILGNLLALRLMSAIVLLGIAPLAVLFFPYPSAVKLAVAVAAVSFLAIALNQILVGLFQKHLRMDRVSIAEVASRLVLVAGVIVAVKLSSGLLGIMVATVASSVVSFLFHFIFSRRFVRIRLHFDLSVWKKIITRSWPLAITIVLNLVYLKTDTLLLSLIPRQTEIGILAEVGLYGAAYRVIDVLITIPFMFAGIILPILTARWALGKRGEFCDILQKSFDVMIILALPIILGTQFLAKQAMILVAGEEFSAAGPILQVLILAAALIYFGVMFTHAIIAIGKQKQIIGAYLFTAITAVAMYFVFIPRFSYWGAAWATIYSELAIALASAWLIWRYTKFIPKFNIFFKSLLASLVMGLMLYLLNSHFEPSIFTSVGLAILLYFSLLYILKGISQKDIKLLLNR